MPYPITIRARDRSDCAAEGGASGVEFSRFRSKWLGSPDERSDIRGLETARRRPGYRCAHPGYTVSYFSDELTSVNLVESVGPMPCTTAMIAKAMPQAIRQYSIAVAPDWSRRNFAITTAPIARNATHRRSHE